MGAATVLRRAGDMAVLNSAGFRLFENPRRDPSARYDQGRREVLSLAGFSAAEREITSWPGYRPTPLRCLRKLASAVQVGDIYYKDEV